ncbi:MAG TPA: class I SAM-dependent methyltransferase [Fimbriimonas sp.]|nr:class I SAM-dependent methyltransferase [Fimbriimonas sp.]
MLINFGESLARHLPTLAEPEVHPHVPEERADLFHSVGADSPELETLTLLNALVCLFKPELALVTGTASGYSTVAIASALRSNRNGRVHTIELDEGVATKAHQNMLALDSDLESWITYHIGDSRAFIQEWMAPPLDFVFFDSPFEVRHAELELMLRRGMLADGAVCVFHDTSPGRAEYSDDFDPETLEALNRFSAGKQWIEAPYSRGLRVVRLT